MKKGAGVTVYEGGGGGLVRSWQSFEAHLSERRGPGTERDSSEARVTIMCGERS